MLLRAEDQAKFQGRIDDKGATVWASYRIEGRVEGKPVVQSDKRMFASEQEARTWLVGEAEERGFKDFEPEVHAGGVTLVQNDFVVLVRGYVLMNARRSALTWSFRVEHSPCGAPG